jgi:hypothetical protein
MFYFIIKLMGKSAKLFICLELGLVEHNVSMVEHGTSFLFR